MVAGLYCHSVTSTAASRRRNEMMQVVGDVVKSLIRVCARSQPSGSEKIYLRVFGHGNELHGSVHPRACSMDVV